MAEQAAALAWTVRLQALAAHLGVEAQDQELPVQSRIAQIEQNFAQLVTSHASLRQLLAQESRLQALSSSGDTLIEKNEDVDAQLAIVLDNDEGMRSFLEAMETCRSLDEQGISGSGHLALHESLEAQLSGCETEQAVQRERLQNLEHRVHALLGQYGDYVCVYDSHQVDQLSRIFIALDDAVHQLEAVPSL